MGDTVRLSCRDCGELSDAGRASWRCACGGIFDLALRHVTVDVRRVRQGPASLWRYRDALPLDRTARAGEGLSLGEGFTPLLRERFGELQIGLKVEFASPTLSFKDRGAVVLVAHALALGVDRVVADSSGNAGTAISAYASRGGIECRVYVPAGTSEAKLAQMRAHGAQVTLVDGTRDDAAKAAIDDVTSTETFYASHVYSPYFAHGVKTYGYEVVEQLGWKAPDTLIVPVGNGTMLLGVHLAFAELVTARIVERRPRIVAVQAAGCAPLAHAFAAERTITPPVNRSTIAEGIAIAHPARGAQLLEIVRDSGGWFVTVDDDEILDARSRLAARGLYVEPTAAAPLAAALKASALGAELGSTVAPLSGAGLKSA